MKLKRLAALGLCSCLSFAMTVPAFAATTPNSTKITATFQEIPISVTVPPTATAIINPYGLPYDVKSDDGEGVAASISGQEITTVPAAIVNKCGTKLDVGATVIGTVNTNSTMKLLSAAPDEDSEVKSAYMYLEMKATDLTQSAIDDKGAVLMDSLAPVAKDWAVDTSNTNIVVVGTKAMSNEEDTPLATLAAATKNKSGEYEVAAGGIALFRLSGKTVKKPKVAWDKNDKVTVDVAFTFSPNTTPDKP